MYLDDFLVHQQVHFFFDFGFRKTQSG